MAIDLQHVIRNISLLDYINLYGSLWDAESRQFVPFKPWEGQKDLINWMEWRNPKTGKIEFREEVWVPKARQLGISEIACERAVKQMLSYARTQIVVISKSENDAAYLLHKRLTPKVENLPPYPGIQYPTIVRHTADTLELSNGSTVMSLAPTAASGASMTLDAIIFDEMGGIDMQPNCDASVLYKNAMPATEKSRRAGIGWVMGIGTSEPGSFFNNHLKKQRDGLVPKKYYFLSWKTDPSRDAAWVKATKDGLESEADFYNQFPSNMNEFFATREGSVFPSFNPELGQGCVVAEHPKWDQYELMVGYDHGFHHWAACLFCWYNPFTDHLHVAHELFWKGVDVTPMAADISAHLAAVRIVPKVMLADTQIFNRDARKSVADHFRDAGLVFKGAYKADEIGSRGMLSERFTFKKITIHKACQNTIRQLADYRWNPKTKGEKPNDKEDEAPDILRWISAHLRREEPQRRQQAQAPSSYGRGEQAVDSGRVRAKASVRKKGGWQAG